MQIDTDLIEEIKQLKTAVQPDEILLVADAALGQEAVNVAKHFHEAVDITGIILTKLDGDARGGAALSMKTITDTPIKFMGTGEKVDEFDVFHPDRMASRILGMGDVVSLVEKAQETIDEKEAERMAEKMRKAEFNLDDFLKQMQQVKKMGSLGSIVSMLPGASGIEIGDEEEKKMARTEAIILSMTKKERPRACPKAAASSAWPTVQVQVRDVNALLRNSPRQKMMKMMAQGLQDDESHESANGRKWRPVAGHVVAETSSLHALLTEPRSHRGLKQSPFSLTRRLLLPWCLGEKTVSV